MRTAGDSDEKDLRPEEPIVWYQVRPNAGDLSAHNFST